MKKPTDSEEAAHNMHNSMVYLMPDSCDLTKMVPESNRTLTCSMLGGQVSFESHITSHFHVMRILCTILGTIEACMGLADF